MVSTTNTAAASSKAARKSSLTKAAANVLGARLAHAEQLLELIDDHQELLAGIEGPSGLDETEAAAADEVLGPGAYASPPSGSSAGRNMATRQCEPPPARCPRYRAGDQAGTHQRGLTAARGAYHRQEARVREAFDQLVDLIVAAEVQGRFVGFERTQRQEGIVGPVHRQRRARPRSSSNGVMGSGAKGPNCAITRASRVL
jgi:hypothetical protein